MNLFKPWGCACNQNWDRKPLELECKVCGACNPSSDSIKTAIIELMVRAPAVPEWFEPDMTASAVPYAEIPLSEYTTDSRTMESRDPEWREFFKKDKIWQAERVKQRLLQWPRAYALMVLEAK